VYFKRRLQDFSEKKEKKKRIKANLGGRLNQSENLLNQ